jgi:hypothetical protein
VVIGVLLFLVTVIFASKKPEGETNE